MTKAKLKILRIIIKLICLKQIILYMKNVACFDFDTVVISVSSVILEINFHAKHVS